jgi:geranylgeranyl pyrophosphate synthase
MTLPLIMAYKKATVSQQSLIESTLLNPEKFEKNFSLIQELLKETQAIESTLAFAKNIQEDALKNLLKLEKTPERDLLESTLHFSLNRAISS